MKKFIIALQAFKKRGGRWRKQDGYESGQEPINLDKNSLKIKNRLKI